MKRLKYEKPVLKSLNETHFAKGRCKTGTNEVGDTDCMSGAAANLNCRYGNIAESGGKCWDGGSNTNFCRQGGAA
ncbi:MAG: hypothetical protein KJ737_27030 [Proteobacteria bacterium]|nr:hypothetical protein [Pseudomonadota bacterium]